MMNYIAKSLSEELADPFISLKTLSDWTGQSVNTLRNEWKRNRLTVHRLSARCLRVRMSEAKRYVAERAVKAAA
jgi:lambda repressor-like predicted transcriptional regulator